MSFMTSIVNALNSVGSWFYEIYLDIYGWVYPFWLSATLFYQLSSLFYNLAWYFSSFSSWVSDTANKVTQILSWSTIWSYILSYVPNLTQMRDWFYSWATNVTNNVNTWWAATSVTVQGWISIAVQPFNAMLANWNYFIGVNLPAIWANIASVWATWDMFVTGTLQTLVNFTWLTTWWNSRLLDIQDLLNSAFLARDSLWAGWQDLRDQVVEFFTNPVEYIWGRFTDWFLGPEG